MKTKKIRRRAASAGRYLLLSMIALFMLFPLIWMVSSSFKDITKIFEYPPKLIPRPFKPENYIEIFRVQPHFPRYFWNSFYIAVVVTAGTCVIASLGGYAFAKIRFPFSDGIFLMLLSAMMIPTEVTAVPLYEWFTRLGLINTHIPLILPAIFASGSMFGLFLMRQHFLTIPHELVEAAKIDGCSQPGIFILVMMPMSKSALSTLCIMTFLNRWNEFFEPLIYLNSSRLYTLPLALSMLSDSQTTEWSLIMVASVLASIPLLVVFFAAQNKFIDSIAMSGIK